MKRAFLACAVAILPLAFVNPAGALPAPAQDGQQDAVDRATRIRRARKRMNEVKAELDQKKAKLEQLEENAPVPPTVQFQLKIEQQRESVREARAAYKKAKERYEKLSQAPQSGPGRQPAGDPAPADRDAGQPTDRRAPTDGDAGQPQPEGRERDGDRAPADRDIDGELEEMERESRKDPVSRKPGSAAGASEMRRFARECFTTERQHRERLARIDRLTELYREKGNETRLQELEEMRDREIVGYERRMAAYRSEMGPEAFAVVEAALEVGRERSADRGLGAERSQEVRDRNDARKDERERQKHEQELERERRKHEQELEREREKKERENERERGKGKGKGGNDNDD